MASGSRPVAAGRSTRSSRSIRRAVCRYALRKYVEEDPRWQRERSAARPLGARRRAAQHRAAGQTSTRPTARGGWSPTAATWRPRRLPTGHPGPAADRRASASTPTTPARHPGDPGGPRSGRNAISSPRPSSAIDEAQRLTENQAMILGCDPPAEPGRGPRGSRQRQDLAGVEQARRLTADGQRVALLVLLARTGRVPASGRPDAAAARAAGLRRRVPQPRPSVGRRARQRRRQRLLGAPLAGADALNLPSSLPTGDKFDAIIVDEAQDFADDWWPAVLARFEGRGDRRALRVQRRRPAGLRSLRAAAGAAAAAHARPEPAQHQADRAHLQLARTDADAALRWRRSRRPVRRMHADGRDRGRRRRRRSADRRGLATRRTSLCSPPGAGTPSRPSARHSARTPTGKPFWDSEQVFYGHVLGFKGLERRAVVLVLNEREIGDRSRERLYVGLSRARDQLVVCGSSTRIRELGGESVLRFITGPS